MKETVEIKAGEELDELIAKLVDVEYCSWVQVRPNTVEVMPTFHPSSVLDNVFVAAGKVWSEFAVKRRANGNYELEAFCDGDDGWSRFEGEYPTPALAICAAILMVKGIKILINDTQKLEAGPDLDLKVAQAIGLLVRRRNHLETGELFDYIDLNGHQFAPSTNLNDAFEAAGKVSMFDRCGHILSRGSANEPLGPWWVASNFCCTDVITGSFPGIACLVRRLFRTSGDV